MCSTKTQHSLKPSSPPLPSPPFSPPLPSPLLPSLLFPSPLLPSLLPSPPFSSPPLPSLPLPSSRCVQVLYQLLHSTDLCVVQCSLCCLIQFAKGGEGQEEGQALVEVQGVGEVHLLFHMVQEFDTTTQQ